jgi:Fe-S oxidoreductase/Ni,Fe-hydrogenase I cytochrome b subunit
MLHWIEAIIFIILLIFTIYGFFHPLYTRYRLIKLANPENRFDRPLKRVTDAVTSFFFLTCSIKKERLFLGFVHFFFLYGSLTFDTVSVNHILEGFNTNWNVFGHGWVRRFHSGWVDVFAIMVLIAVTYFVIRRYVFRPKSYTYPSIESVLIYTLLITVTITFLLYEGAAIAQNPDHAYLSFVGKAIAGWLPSNPLLVKIYWWIHILNVFLFVLYVPRSKYLHMIAGPINIAFQDYHPKGIIKPINLENENAESFGVVNVTDLTWKDLLDGFACVDCGRCDDYCPANQSGKPLSPKNLIVHLKEYLLREKNELLKGESSQLKPLMENIYTDDEIWTCTSCGACMHVCPVKNEHLRKIIGLRQSRALMEAKFPTELNQFFKNMETNSNPWGFGSATRGDWAEDLDIKTLSQDSDVDILYWVGCAGSFDDRGKKVSTAMVKILRAAGINFGILGVEENCCGDQARRLGNEYLFQMVAQENINVIRQYNIKKILVTCPHGYNTFKNEYPELAKSSGIDDWNVEVIHHSQLIAELIRQGKLDMKQKINASVTFHDPCYLGRHNGIFDAPRSVLSQSGAKLKEMKKNRYHSFCCGAGGGLMWTEEHLGTRINHIRTDQALETGTEIIATSCPFCMTMLDDGVKDKGKDEACSVKDIAEIVARCLSQ